jgi:hypothetical protein
MHYVQTQSLAVCERGHVIAEYMFALLVSAGMLRHSGDVQVSEPQRFHKIQSAVDKMLDGSNCTISEFMSDAVAELRRDHLHVEDIEGRPKSLRSISDKVTAKGGLQVGVWLAIRFWSMHQLE